MSTIESMSRFVFRQKKEKEKENCFIIKMWIRTSPKAHSQNPQIQAPKLRTKSIQIIPTKDGLLIGSSF